MEKKKVIAFDIDGTLTHRLDWIDPKVIQALKNLHEKGWLVALLTGRIFSFAWTILQHFDFPYLLAVQNGADILEMPTKKTLRREYLKGELLPQIDQAYQGEKEDYIIYAGIDQGDFCYFRPEKFSEKTLKYLKILESLGKAPWKPSDFSFPREMTFPLIKCFGTEEGMKRVHDKLLQNSEIEVSMIRDPVDPTLYLNLITHPKAHKGEVIRFLRDRFESPFIIGAGDDRNDLKMLHEADLSIVMETAPKEMWKVGDILSKPAKELGILEAIQEAIKRAK